MFEDEEGTAILSFILNSENTWYIENWQKISQDPRNYPDWNIRGSQLYKFRSETKYKNVADDDKKCQIRQQIKVVQRAKMGLMGHRIIPKP
ncbi:hypothetical protein TKK_0017653 [Trichogramma kaykai]